MKKFIGRAAEVERDLATYIEWLKAASDINLVDGSVYSYPSLASVVVERDGEPVLMNSFHPVFMMEALAPKPGLNPLAEALALLELYRCLRNAANTVGVKEIWFTCSDERLVKFIEGRGWRRVNTPVFKMVVGGETDPLNESQE